MQQECSYVHNVIGTLLLHYNDDVDDDDGVDNKKMLCWHVIISRES